MRHFTVRRWWTGIGALMRKRRREAVTTTEMAG
jgi:hypothetical protein